MIMNEQYENKLDEMERVENALSQSRRITKDAKYLCYPILDIKVKLSSLAEEHGLGEEMEEYLEEVSNVSNKLESAFFKCDEVFTNKKSSLECELLDIEEQESESNDN